MAAKIPNQRVGAVRLDALRCSSTLRYVPTLSDKGSVMRIPAWTWLGCILLATVLGCGGSSDAPSAVGDTATASGVKKIAAEKLPKLGDALPPLDGGRVGGLAPPDGWLRLEKDSKFLTRFVIDKTSGNPPRILITAEDAPSSFTDNVTTENVEAFATAVAAELEGKKLVEGVKPIIIGDNAYARYVALAKKGNRSVDRQLLVTQYDGRRYIIALEVWAGEEEMRKHRDRAYAVAAGATFGENATPMLETKTEE